MIFPNRAPAPEIRPGMGYAPGANVFGYVAHMGYVPGASTLGDFSASEENAAVDAGIAPSDIDLLNNLGATDQDLQNLINGNVTLQQLYAQYGATIPSSSPAAATAAATPAASAAPGGSTAQIPPGSTILYSASFNPAKNFVTASSVISSIAAQLAAYHMSMITDAVQQSGITSAGAFTMTIMDSIGHQYTTDAQSILDSLLNQFTGNGRITSSVTVVTPGTTAGGTPGTAAATPASDPVAWLESNAIYIALAVGGLIFLNNFTGGKRR